MYNMNYRYHSLILLTAGPGVDLYILWVIRNRPGFFAVFGVLGLANGIKPMRDD